MITTLGRGMGVRFDEAALQQVFNATAGHPFLARQVCSVAAKINTVRPVTLDGKRLNAAVEKYLETEANTDLEEILRRFARDYPEEHSLLQRIASMHDPIKSSQLGLPSVQSRRQYLHLIEYQILREEGGNLSFRMAMIKPWLSRFQPSSRGRR